MDSPDKLDLTASRHQYDVLISCRKGDVTSPVRHALNSVGFVKITSRNTFTSALDEAEHRKFPLVFFDARADEMSALNEGTFIENFVKLHPDAVLIAVSTEPTAENIFKTIKHGAKGYLIGPYTPESVEAVILRACEDPTIDEEVLQDPNRNKALARYILSRYDRLTKFMHEVKLASETPEEYEEKLIEGIDRHSVHLAHAVRVAKIFVEGTEMDLAEAIVNVVMEKQKAKSRIGSTRERLRNKRKREVAA